MATKLGRTIAPFVAALCAASIAAAGEKSPAPAVSLEQLGLRLEEARSMTAVQARPALDGILQTLTDNAIGKLPEERRAGARFLLAETLLSAGEFRRSADEFSKAEKAANKGTFAEDAAFGVLRAREAAGDDAGAAKEWERWLEKNPAKAKAFLKVMREATEWLNADKARTLAEARKGFPMKPEALALALEQNKWDMDVALSQTQALAKIGVDRKYVSRDVSADLPKVLNDTLLKDVIAGK